VGPAREKPPLIVVTTSELRSAEIDHPKPESDPPRTEMALGLRYLEAIEAAGGIPVVTPPLGPVAARALLDRVDGLCLSGGPDIHPRAYGSEPHPELGPTEPELDAFELELVREADQRGLPILAICRGAQLLNVARGGTLHQHLPDIAGDAIQHRQPLSSVQRTHMVSIEPESRLAALLRRRRVKVNSFHHQAIEVVGDDLFVSARASDGTVEAVEGGDDRYVTAVQWHAESLSALLPHNELFRSFVAAAAGEPLPARRPTEPPLALGALCAALPAS
jgi:putative glutamine amidotransferase